MLRIKPDHYLMPFTTTAKKHGRIDITVTFNGPLPVTNARISQRDSLMLKTDSWDIIGTLETSPSPPVKALILVFSGRKRDFHSPLKKMELTATRRVRGDVSMSALIRLGM